jgi:hypothetical protein
MFSRKPITWSIKYCLKRRDFSRQKIPLNNNDGDVEMLIFVMSLPTNQSVSGTLSVTPDVSAAQPTNITSGAKSRNA